MADETSTETIYAQESLGSEDLKLVRLARVQRGMAITNPAAHIAMVGCLAGSNLIRDDQAFQKEVEHMIDHLVDLRDRLVWFGVLPASLIGYFPYQVAPITENLIVLTARNSAAKPGFQGYKLVD